MVQLSDECENRGWWECISADGEWGDIKQFGESADHWLEDLLHW